MVGMVMPTILRQTQTYLLPEKFAIILVSGNWTWTIHTRGTITDNDLPNKRGNSRVIDSVLNDKQTNKPVVIRVGFSIKNV